MKPQGSSLGIIYILNQTFYFPRRLVRRCWGTRIGSRTASYVSIVESSQREGDARIVEPAAWIADSVIRELVSLKDEEHNSIPE